MAAKAGYGGDVTFSGLTAGVRGWAVEAVANTVDVTTFADDGVSAFLKTTTLWSGTMACLWDTANTIVVGDSGVLTAYPSSGTADPFSGTIIVTGIGYSSQHDGVVEAPVTFQGTGALTIA